MDQHVKIKDYDHNLEISPENAKILEEYDLIIRKTFAVHTEQGGKILDLGHGQGTDAKFFTERGFMVTCVDLSIRMLSKTRTSMPIMEMTIMGILNLRFRPESFDAVWFEEGLTCITKGYSQKLMEDINNVIKVGGFFYTCVKEQSSVSDIPESRKDEYYNEVEISSILANAGFEIIKIYRPTLRSDDAKHKVVGFICRKNRNLPTLSVSEGFNAV
jgi:ubiquinone/menaquinone biosynthesis C-methylase UbiE